MKRIAVFLLGLCIMLGCAACMSDVSGSDIENSGENISTSILFEDIFQDETLSKNFKAVCQMIGMEPKDISHMEKEDDWAGGPRYSFIYHKAPFKLYCNIDSTVESVKIGTEIDIFKRGFEPYLVSDYIATDDEKLQLQLFSEDTIKKFLNYPDSADFHTMDWRFGRDHDFYNTSGTVTAQNAFGMEEKVPFSVVYHVVDTHFSAVYVRLGDVVQINELDQYPHPERKPAERDEQVSTKMNVDEKAIILEDGQLGEYGREDKVDDEVYIDFYVPAGKYIVKNLSNRCIVFATDNDTNEPVTTLEFSELEEEKELTVEENQHLELTIYGKVALVPME